MYEQLSKRKVDICCLRDVKWRGQRTGFVCIKNRRNKLWASGNNDGIGGFGIFLKKESCEKVLEV